MRRGAPLVVLLLPGLALAQVQQSFRNGSSGYTGMRDVAIIGDDGEPWQPNTNYDTRDLWIDGSPNNEGTLMRFDVAAIPSAAMVTSVTLTLTFLNATADSYPVYAMNRAWVANQATWNNATTAQAWSIAGAQGGGDRGSTSLATITGSGTAAFAFNASGRTVVQNWIATGVNNGFTIQDYAAGNGANLAHCDSSTAASRPQLVVVTTMGTFTFRNGVSPMATYVGCTDTAIASGVNPETTNWDNSNNFELDTTKSIWVSVDLNAVPPWSTVLSASMDVSLITPVASTFFLYEARRPWVEGAATWLTYDGTNAWQAPGGQGALDRDSAVVGDWVNPSATSLTMNFHDAGVALVTRWVRQPATNLGFAIWNPMTVDSCRYDESEVGTVTARPRFNVSYFEGRVGSGTAGATTGTPSAIAIARERLDDGVSIALGAPALTVGVSATAPGQVSIDGGGWASSAVVTIPAGQSTAPLLVLSPTAATVFVQSDAGRAWVGGTYRVVFSDAGAPDAGTPDAGPPDAGTPDAGTPDAGTPDAGTPLDAGTPDAGTPDAGTPDAGRVLPDGGVDPNPRTVGVGCDCSSAGGAAWLALLVLAGYGRRRWPRR